MSASWPQLLILVAVIVLLFGTKKLRNLGSDLGASIKGFKKSMSDDKENSEQLENSSRTEQENSAQDNVTQNNKHKDSVHSETSSDKNKES